MRLIVLLITGMIINCLSYGQNFSKAKVYANGYELMQLANEGVAIDHGKWKKDTWFISDFSENELAIMDSMGIGYDILVYDMQSFYKRGLSSDAELNPSKVHQFGDPHIRGNRAACGGGSANQISYPVPSNFSLGSMGGYLTYAEFLQNIDDMATQYPNLITPKEELGPVGSEYMTHENNPIYWLKISDNPSTDETTEPEVLYTAIHHAREPASLSQLIYYMWYLLENYGIDPEVTYLVDNVEMYFVPMINPDGYIINETTDPSGGGMWRKNARDNDSNGSINGQDGVDLNRNYSYQWGVSGASTNPSAQDYMGPGPFSEPETQAMKWFCENREFEIAQNAHTYEALLLHPFGYDNIQTADHNQYQEWTALMVDQNGYSNILSANLYPAAGDSDDWMYAGDLATKPKVFAMTPEIGEDAHGFWPATSEIQRICNDMVWQNLHMAHLALDMGTAQDLSESVYPTSTGYFKYEVQRLGLDNGTLEVAINPVGVGLASSGGPNQHTGLNMLQTEVDSIAYTLDGSLTSGQEFDIELTISNGSFTWRDTVTKVYGSSAVLYSDNASSMGNWTSSQWNTTTNDYYSPSSSITDSPGGNYSNNTSSEIELVYGMDLSNATSANVTFWAKWNIENNYDYCQLLGSSDGGNTWTPLCGKYTNTGTNDQDAGEPLWDGAQNAWVEEFVDLGDYLGQTVRLKFRLVSDVFVTEDGFYFDDFEVNAFIPGSIEENTAGISIMNAMPNPASTGAWIQYELPDDLHKATIEVVNSVGQVVMNKPAIASANKVRLNVEGLSEGVYFVRIVSNGYTSEVKRLSIVR